MMTDTQIETLVIIYALGDAIQRKDLASAGLMQEWLLNTVSPLTQPLATDSYQTQKESYGPEIRH